MTDTNPDVQQAPVDPNEVRITVNGREVVSTKGELVIKAAERSGEYIPHFCYHPRMEPVGMCRMCLVEIDTGRGPMLQPSCMVPVAPGMKVDTESVATKRAQEGILELLLANHPLDCPVCDKGGECPLQDQAFSHGPGESRFVEEKRHYEKPIPISDIVYLDRERCILCDRCTRFADEVAGDALIHFTSRGNDTHITTFPDEPFSSYFSGNTVQICPVGALTAKPYRFKARPWDLSQQESTCTTCSVGCRIVVQSSRDEVLRYMGVDSDPVNHGWLCDRGRFNFEQTKHEDRVVQPLVRRGASLQPATWSDAIARAATLINEARDTGGAGSIVVIGGARGTNEDAFAWSRLLREVVRTPHVDAQLGDGLPPAVLGLPRATIDEAASAATVILLAPDIKEELPVLYLRLRTAADRRRTRIIEFAPALDGISPYAWRTVHHEPGLQADAVRQTLADPAVAAQIASGDVVVVVGRGNLAEHSDATVAALQTVLELVPSAKVLPALRRGNVVGAVQLGLTPGANGLDTTAALQAAADGKVECMVLLGADPIADFPDADLAARALAGARRLIAVDSFLTQSSQLASVVLAASAFGEKAGTTTNIEGRVTTVARQVTPRGSTRADWMIAAELALELHGDLGYTTVDDVTADIAERVPAYAAATPAALAAAADGVLTALPEGLPALATTGRAAGERNSYDFRLVTSRTMYDLATGTQKSPSIAHLALNTLVHVNPLDVTRIGTVDGASVKVISPRATVVLEVIADKAVQRGTVWVPFNHPGANAADLIDCTAPVTDVRIETI